MSLNSAAYTIIARIADIQIINIKYLAVHMFAGAISKLLYGIASVLTCTVSFVRNKSELEPVC